MVIYLSGSGFCLLLFDLDFDDIARMLYDFGDKGTVPSTNFSHNSLQKVDKATIHPVLPKDPYPAAKWWDVGFDHAECSMYCPEDEEDNEKMMRIPEPLEFRTTRFFHRG